MGQISSASAGVLDKSAHNMRLTRGGGCQRCLREIGVASTACITLTSCVAKFEYHNVMILVNFVTSLDDIFHKEVATVCESIKKTFWNGNADKTPQDVMVERRHLQEVAIFKVAIVVRPLFSGTPRSHRIPVRDTGGDRSRQFWSGDPRTGPQDQHSGGHQNHQVGTGRIAHRWDAFSTW